MRTRIWQLLKTNGKRALKEDASDSGVSPPSAAVQTDHPAEVRQAAALFGTDDFDSMNAILGAFKMDNQPLPDQVFLHRNTERKYLDMKRGLIFNNPEACANTTHGYMAGINFLVSKDKQISNRYSGEVSLVCDLRDVFRLGGRVFADMGALACGAVLVTMPEKTGLPFKETANMGQQPKEWVYDPALRQYLPTDLVSSDPALKNAQRYIYDGKSKAFVPSSNPAQTP